MAWRIVLARSAEKELRKAPPADRTRLRAALGQMEANPFSGDVARLTGGAAELRRRVGAWRIMFNLRGEDRIIEVLAIVRRTSTTYRRR